MALPKAIAAEVEARLSEPDRHLGLDPSGALVLLGGDCVGAKFHSPRPLMTYEVHTENCGTVRLCGTCRDNLRLLEKLRDEGDDELPWPVLREFGNLIRELGKSA